MADIVALGIDGRCIDPDGLVLPPLEFLSMNNIRRDPLISSSPVLQANGNLEFVSPAAGTSTNFTKVVDARQFARLIAPLILSLQSGGCLPDSEHATLGLRSLHRLEWNIAIEFTLLFGWLGWVRNELVSKNIAALSCPDGLEQPSFPHLSMPRCLTFDDHQIVFSVD